VEIIMAIRESINSCAKSGAPSPLPALVAVLLLALGGCATCQQHPVACGVAGAVIVGSIAAAVQHHHDQQHQAAPGMSNTQPVNCAATPSLCQ
jgi:hypothetical protein